MQILSLVTKSIMMCLYEAEQEGCCRSLKGTWGNTRQLYVSSNIISPTLSHLLMHK